MVMREPLQKSFADKIRYSSNISVFLENHAFYSSVYFLWLVVPHPCTKSGSGNSILVLEVTTHFYKKFLTLIFVFIIL